MPTSSAWLAIAAAVALLSASGAEAQTRIVLTTKDFVAAAAQSDQFEIVEGRTALVQARDPRVRTFAQEMIQVHTGTSQDLQSAAMKAGVTMTPPGMNGDQQKMLSALQSQRGVDFDRTYLKQQVLAHQVALVVEQAYATQGADANVKQAARAAVLVIKRHLAMAEQLRSALARD